MILARSAVSCLVYRAQTGREGILAGVVSARLPPLARLALVALFVALALASVVRTLPRTWDWLSAQRTTFAGLSPAARAQAPGLRAALPVEAFDFFRAHLRRRDRFYVQVGGAPQQEFFRGVSRETAFRTFGRFYLLPSVLVDDPHAADVILSVGADPQRLGVALAPVTRSPNGDYSVARVRR